MDVNGGASWRVFRRRRRMRHVAVFIVLYMMLGMVSSVTFLWAAVYSEWLDRSPSTKFGYSEVGPDNTVWFWQYYSRFGAYFCRTDIVSAAAPREAGPSHGPIGWRERRCPWWSVAAEENVPSPARMVGYFVVDYAFGWPVPCAGYRESGGMWNSAEAEIAPWKYRGAVIVDENFSLRKRSASGHDVVWPTRVLWRGVVANVVLLALLWAAPHVCGWWVFHKWRAFARSRPLKCPWCGLDRTGLAEDAACSGCGGREPVMSRLKGVLANSLFKGKK